MKRMNIIMVSVFLAGILMIGIGAGVAFGEYSSMEYVGEKKVGLEKTEEMTLEYEIATGKKAKKTIVNSYGYGDYEVETDKKIPVGTIQFEVVYNPEYIEPRLDYQPMEDIYNDQELYEGELYLIARYKGNDVNLFFEYKDEMLDNLKNHKIASYNFNPWKSVVMKVHPKTLEYIEEM